MNFFSKRNGFGIVEAMYYLTMISLVYEITYPGYDYIIAQFKSQELIKLAQQAQLTVAEYSIINGKIPEEMSFDQYKTKNDHSIEWTGDSIVIEYDMTPDERYFLALYPTIEKHNFNWECTMQAPKAVVNHVCYALT